MKLTLWPTLILPALGTSIATAAIPEEDKRLLRELQPAAQARTDAALKTFWSRVHTEDPALNDLAVRIYSRCILNRLYDPLPPTLPNRWLAPGGLYVGQWLWDTMFVVSAYAALDDDATIRGVFENYWYTIDHNPLAPPGSVREGMVPNHLRRWPPVGYSQIPLLAWGCVMVERQTGERALLERSLPYLLRFDEWYSRERDVDGDALVEYGAYEPAPGGAKLPLTARYESFDLQPTTFGIRMTPHPQRPSEGAWYGNREGIEQTCFLIMSEQSIAEIARKLGQEPLARQYEAKARRRVEAIQSKMWDPATRFFYSLDRDTDARLPIRGIGAFLTLTCGAATEQQAAALVEQLQDPRQWWSRYPVPTVAMDDAKFSPRGYWSGDMWPPTTYLVTLGLNRYGYHDLAREITGRMLDLVARQGVNERYDATTGEALGIRDLGMSCCIWSMVVQNLYGLQDDFRTVRVPDRARGRSLILGGIELRYPDDHSVELKTRFDREMTVSFASAPRRGIEVTAQGRRVSAVHLDEQRVRFPAAPGQWYRVTSQPSS